ncbi:MAG: alpha-ketoglutarate-dependent dioxygenase AlkB family protein [Myxococcota bacterium]
MLELPFGHECIALGDGAWVDLWPRCVADPGDRWLGRLRDELPLAQETYRMGAREVNSPRLVSWHGDAGTGYAYSGVAHEPHPWTPGLAELRRRIQDVTGLTFNSVLANLYRGGEDSMGWHADREPEIGPTPDDRWIASLSLGARRRFLLKSRAGAKRAFELGEGDLLVMRGTTQDHWRHALPKTRRPVGPRLNLTFRHVTTRS